MVDYNLLIFSRYFAIFWSLSARSSDCWDICCSRLFSWWSVFVLSWFMPFRRNKFSSSRDWSWLYLCLSFRWSFSKSWYCLRRTWAWLAEIGKCLLCLTSLLLRAFRWLCSCSLLWEARSWNRCYLRSPSLSTRSKGRDEFDVGLKSIKDLSV